MQDKSHRVQRLKQLVKWVSLAAIPVSILAGTLLMGDRRYYIISLLVIALTLTVFLLSFERRTPNPREMMVLAVMVAITVAGRAAFFMLPQVKPMIALIIIGGAAMGAESGFLMGALTAFLSNFFAGQGPWTPWQMLAFGLIGFLAGVFFKQGRLPRHRWVLCLFGGLCTILVFGGIVNPSSILMYSDNVNLNMILAGYVSGLPFDAIHAVSTIAFLLVLGKPMLSKLERIKEKYGIFQN